MTAQTPKPLAIPQFCRAQLPPCPAPLPSPLPCLAPGRAPISRSAPASHPLRAEAASTCADDVSRHAGPNKALAPLPDDDPAAWPDDAAAPWLPHDDASWPACDETAAPWPIHDDAAAPWLPHDDAAWPDDAPCACHFMDAPCDEYGYTPEMLRRYSRRAEFEAAGWMPFSFRMGACHEA